MVRGSSGRTSFHPCATTIHPWSYTSESSFSPAPQFPFDSHASIHRESPKYLARPLAPSNSSPPSCHHRPPDMTPLRCHKPSPPDHRRGRETQPHHNQTGSAADQSHVTKPDCHQSHSNRVLHRQKAHRGTARRSRVSPQRKYSWDVAELPAFLDALRASISFSRTPSPGSKPTSDGLNLGGSHALAPSTDRPWAIRNSRLK